MAADLHATTTDVTTIVTWLRDTQPHHRDVLTQDCAATLARTQDRAVRAEDQQRAEQVCLLLVDLGIMQVAGRRTRHVHLNRYWVLAGLYR